MIGRVFAFLVIHRLYYCTIAFVYALCILIVSLVVKYIGIKQLHLLIK